MGIRKIYWIIKYEFRGSHILMRNFKFEFPTKNFPPKYDSFALWQISCCWFLNFPAKRYRRVRDIGLSRLVKNMKNVKNVKNTKTISISQKSLPVTNLRFLKLAGNSNFGGKSRPSFSMLFTILWLKIFSQKMRSANYSQIIIMYNFGSAVSLRNILANIFFYSGIYRSAKYSQIIIMYKCGSRISLRNFLSIQTKRGGRRNSQL